MKHYRQNNKMQQNNAIFGEHSLEQSLIPAISHIYVFKYNIATKLCKLCK